MDWSTSSSGKPRRQTVTGVDGGFAVFRLVPGTYHVTAELEGFSSQERTVWVPAGRTAQFELVMLLAEVTEEIIVTSEMPRSFSSTVAVRGEIEDRQRQQAARRELQSMQGLVGGVKPLAVEIPESGKLLLLAGVLPPADVGVELEVKSKR